MEATLGYLASVRRMDPVDAESVSAQTARMTTEERLDLLERRVVLQRRGLFLSWALLGLLAALPAAADKEPPPVTRFDQIVANGITVVSPEGKDVVRIGSLANGHGTVTTFNPAGKVLVQLWPLTDGGGGVATFNPAGKALVSIGSMTTGGGSVTTFNPAGKELVRLGATVGGEGAVATFNPAGKELVRLGATEDGDGAMMISDKSGTPLLGTGILSNTGEGNFVAYNRAGKPRAMWP